VDVLAWDLDSHINVTLEIMLIVSL